ncbi:MAG: hypothetical protein NVS1B4_26010 [Gemmatimonadaceae bacterium]
MRDSFKRISEANAEVLGVSADGVESHQKFSAKLKLPFRLLADTEHVLCEAYGVWGEKSLYGRKYMGIERTTFIIDPNGKIMTVFEKVKPAGHGAEVVAALKGKAQG